MSGKGNALSTPLDARCGFGPDALGLPLLSLLSTPYW